MPFVYTNNLILSGLEVLTFSGYDFSCLIIAARSWKAYINVDFQEFI